MSIVLYHAEKNMVAFIDMPLGRFVIGKKTADGDCVWKRDPPDGVGTTLIVYGSQTVPDDALIVFYCVDDTTPPMKDYSHLVRPHMSKVTLALASGQMGMTDAVGAAKQITNEEMHDAKAINKVKADLIARHKRKSDKDAAVLEAEKKARVDEVQKLQSQIMSEQSARQVAEGKVTQLQGTITSMQPAANGKASKKLQIDDIYTGLTRMCIDDITAYINSNGTISSALSGATNGTVSSKTKSKKTSSSSSSSSVPQVFEWLDDNGHWVSNTDSVFVNAFNQVDSSKATHSYTYMNYPYEARTTTEDPKKHSANALFTQYNTQTSKSRLVRMIDDPAHASSMSSKTLELTALAGTAFITTVSKVQGSQWLSLHDFESSWDHSIGTDSKCIDAITELATLFSKCSQYKFKYDKTKTKPLIKPRQLHSVVQLIASGKAPYIKVCCHCAGDDSITKIVDDPIGLDITYCNQSCRYGKANYIGLTNDAGERNGYNRTSVKGKTVLCLLLGPTNMMSSSDQLPYMPYNFACTERDAKNVPFMDAIAVFSNTHLLPLAVVSP